MKKISSMVLIMNLAIFLSASASDIKTLDEAEKISVQSGKPILLEFYKEDCEYCSQAAQDAINRDDVKNALGRTVHFGVNVKSDYGKKLSERYKVGIYFPAFFLLNSQGEIIKRWTGYTTAARFINDLNSGLSDTTTLEQRIARLERAPDYDDAIYLAKYYTETMDFLVANKYYRKARQLRGENPSLFAYEIFQNTANAAWQDSIPFENVLPAADTVLLFNSNNQAILVKVGQIMARLGRKLEKTNEIGRYLKAAIDATENSRTPSGKKDNVLLKSEYALYVNKDTLEAINLKKSTMPSDWLNKPDEFYGYAKWCLEHKIALDEAEALTRKAVNMASPGEFRGKVLNTLAMICDARGKYSEAAEFMRMAVKEDPKNEFYSDMLAEFEKKAGG
jgi:thioredoxin-related protein